MRETRCSTSSRTLCSSPVAIDVVVRRRPAAASATSPRRSRARSPSRARASRSPSTSSCSRPAAIAATPCATFAGRKSVDRRGDSWLKRIAELACRPYLLRYAATMKLPYAFAAPYGDTGRNGVASDCGVSDGNAEHLGRRRLEEPDRRVERRGSPRAARVTPTVPSCATSTGSSHERGTNDGEARL